MQFASVDLTTHWEHDGVLHAEYGDVCHDGLLRLPATLIIVVCSACRGGKSVFSNRPHGGATLQSGEVGELIASKT